MTDQTPEDKSEIKELSAEEKAAGASLAALIQARVNAEEELFKFFEGIPDENKGDVYDYAMGILKKEAAYIHDAPRMIQ